MSGIDLATLAWAVDRSRSRMATLEQELNSVDAQLGDGDTGVMLARVVDAIAQIDYAAQPHIGAALLLMARKTASATGSSLGTLIATGLRAVGERREGQAAIAYAYLGEDIAAAVAAMTARGGANLGDKTVLDILDAIARALAGAADAAVAKAAAMDACRRTVAEFRNRPCRIGRARMFAEKSIGLDDPGMLAVMELTLAVAGEAA